MKKLLIFSGFVLGNFSILLISFLLLTIYTTKNTVASATQEFETLNQQYQGNESENTNLYFYQSAEIVSRDSRIEIIDNFFKKYHSPMDGLGKDIVAAADKFEIPYGYLPAIGACEGALGQKIPQDSYNTWGWGIYGGKIARFSSWQESIETVSRGLSISYFKRGLDTPEKIMPIYTPPSQGSWAICVNKYLGELR